MCIRDRIYQNCPVFNDGAFDALRDKKQGAVNRIPLVHGEPIRFGVEGENGVVRGPDGVLRIAAVADVGADALVVHDAQRDVHLGHEGREHVRRIPGPFLAAAS